MFENLKKIRIQNCYYKPRHHHDLPLSLSTEGSKCCNSSRGLLNNFRLFIWVCIALCNVSFDWLPFLCPSSSREHSWAISDRIAFGFLFPNVS